MPDVDSVRQKPLVLVNETCELREKRRPKKGVENERGRDKKKNKFGIKNCIQFGEGRDGCVTEHSCFPRIQKVL